MHVVRLYGMEFERPGPRLRDYVRVCRGVCRRTAGMPDVDRIGSQGTCGNRRLPWSRGGGCTSQGRPVISFKSRAGTAIRRSAARSVVSGPDCDTDRRGGYLDLVWAAGRSGRCRCRSRRRFAPVAAGRRRIIIGPIGLTIWGCAGRQRDRRSLGGRDDVLRPRPGDHRRPSNHWSSGQFPAHASTGITTPSHPIGGIDPRKPSAGDRV